MYWAESVWGFQFLGDAEWYTLIANDDKYLDVGRFLPFPIGGANDEPVLFPGSCLFILK